MTPELILGAVVTVVLCFIGANLTARLVCWINEDRDHHGRVYARLLCFYLTFATYRWFEFPVGWPAVVVAFGWALWCGMPA